MNPIPRSKSAKPRPGTALSKNPAARAAAVLMFLAMSLLGWSLAGSSKPATTPAAENPGKTANRPARPTRQSDKPESVRQRMASVRAIASPEERMRATIEMANTLPASEIAGWMEGRWFNTGGGYDLTLFNKILTARWKTEDPEGFLVWSMKNNSSGTNDILASWSKSDPQRVIEFFKNHPDRDRRIRSLAEIAKQNPAFALESLRELPPVSNSEDGMSHYYTSQVLQELAKSSPAELEAALANFPASLKNQAEAILIGQRLQTSFTDEFRKLLERPDGWKVFSESLSNADNLHDKAFGQLANFPPSWKTAFASNPYNLIDETSAAKWADADLEGMGFTEKDAKRIRSVAVGRLLYKEPELALKLMNSGDFDASAKDNMITNLFGNLGDKPEKAEALIALLGTEEEKRKAREMVAAHAETRSEEKIEKPSDWLEKVSAIDPKSGNSYQYLSMLREWNPEKIADLGNQFRSMPDDKKLPIARMLASNSGNSSQLDKELVGDAIHLLVAQPAPPAGESRNNSESPIVQASRFVVDWSKTDPNAAGTWVQSLPAGDAKLWAQKNLAANWAQYDPQEAEQWVKTLPAKDRAEVQKFMKSESGK